MLVDWVKVALDFLAIAIALGALGVTIYNSWGSSARNIATKIDVHDLWEEVGRIRNEVATHGAALTHMPEAVAVTRLEGDIKALTAELRGLSGKLDGTEKWLERIDDFLRREKKT